jgi:hypothetical protein
MVLEAIRRVEPVRDEHLIVSSVVRVRECYMTIVKLDIRVEVLVADLGVSDGIGHDRGVMGEAKVEVVGW